MPVEIVMPRLSDTMETGTIARWLKGEGDAIVKGEPIAEIETDKAMMPLESYVNGTISQILLTEGQSAPIGTPIALVARAGEAVAPRAASTVAAPVSAPPPVTAPIATPPPARVAPTEPAAVVPPTPVAPERVLASPVARRLAEELQIDLRAVVGTGPAGRITKEDVEAVARAGQRPAPAITPTAPPAAPPAPPQPRTTTRPLTRLEETVARRMVQSKSQIPHFYLTTDVDMAAASQLRQQLNAQWTEVRVGFTDLIVRAVTLALEAYPLVNASWQKDQIAYHEDVNIGLAVATEGGGLLVPVLQRTNQSDLRTLAAEVKDLVKRTREGKNRPGDFEGGTFTISNLGAYAVDNFLAIINPPESAILAISRIEKRPVARGDQIVLSERVNLSLSCDHRVFYGAYAAEFMTKLRDLLESPLALLR